MHVVANYRMIELGGSQMSNFLTGRETHGKIIRATTLREWTQVLTSGSLMVATRKRISSSFVPNVYSSFSAFVKVSPKLLLTLRSQNHPISMVRAYGQRITAIIEQIISSCPPQLTKPAGGK